MTPIQAFELLREHRLAEITRGRNITELPDAELLEILRVHGVAIPRFASAEAEQEWEKSDECLSLLTAVCEKAKQASRIRE
jgi:hypothetical protein